MRKKCSFTLLIVFFIGAGSAVMAAESASELLEKGIYTEEMLGDLPKAIEIYQKVVAKGKAAETYAVEAQYRLGQCLLKQKKNFAAAAAFQKLIKTYPYQNEWIAKANKHITGSRDVILAEVPWKDGESLQLDIKVGSSIKVGTYVWSVESTELDGKEVWRMTTHRFTPSDKPEHVGSQVDADKNTFRPIKSLFRHNLLGLTNADYTTDEVTVTQSGGGKNRTRKEKLNGIYYDMEQLEYLFRRLPLTEGYKASVLLYTPYSSGNGYYSIEITGKETIAVPAGKFACYKLFISWINDLFWISADANRYIVKYEVGNITGELEHIGLNKPGEMKSYQDDQEGFSFSAPAGWYFYTPDTPGENNSKVVYLLDPEEVAINCISVWKINNDNAQDQKADAKKLLRTFAEEGVADKNKRTEGL